MRRIMVFTGNGKGKTTAALGAAVRASGSGLKVIIFQFLKPADAEYGEHVFFAKTDIKLVPLGRCSKKDFNYDKEDIHAARAGLKKIKEEIASYDLIILDEISFPVNWGWFNIDSVFEIINQNPLKNFIFTGREMPNELIELADVVSIVEENKHIYQEGGGAQKGFEF